MLITTTSTAATKQPEVSTMTNKEKESQKQALQRRSGAPALTSLDDMERWFHEMFSAGWMRPFFQGWPELAKIAPPFEGRQPRVDLINREEETVLRAELPGVKKEDLDVSMTDNTVTIRASTRHQEEKEEGEYFRKEMSRGEFVRTVAIPDAIDEDKVSASFKDGVLELRLPKLESAKPRSINVE
jgi:HSP20 family protein